MCRVHGPDAFGKTKGFSMNRFGSADNFVVHMRHEIVREGSWPQCMRESGRGLSLSGRENPRPQTKSVTAPMDSSGASRRCRSTSAPREVHFSYAPVDSN